MNVLNKIDEYHIEKSAYGFDVEHQFYFFEGNGVYLDRKKCAGYDIFREQRDVISIYVSEKIKTMVEENNWVDFPL